MLSLNRGERGVFAMASFEANCATVTRLFLLNSISSAFLFSCRSRIVFLRETFQTKSYRPIFLR